MLTDDVLNINRVTQETFKFCAPACIQMLLHYVGVHKTQAEIWNETRSLVADPVRWFTDPDAVASYLQGFHLVSSHAQVGAVINSSLVRYLSRVVRVADIKRFPAVMLVYGGRHWVLCVGIKGEYVDKEHEQVKLSGLYVADPSRGSDGIQFFPINEWFSEEFLSPVRIDGVWKGTLLSVTDTGDDEVDELQILPPSRPSGGGAGELSFDDIFSIAGEDIRHYGLSNDIRTVQRTALSRSGAIIDGLYTARFAHLDDVVMPIPVTKLDDGTVYYLTPLKVGAHISWAAVSARYVGLMAIQLSGSLRLPPTGAKLLVAAAMRFNGSSHINELPGLVWQPSVEFPTWLDVARLVTVDGEPHFVNADGQFFGGLTTDVRG